MKKREIASLACKIIALLVVIRALGSLAFGVGVLIESFTPGGDLDRAAGSTIAAAVPALFYLIVAALLWSRSGFIARGMIGESESEPINLSLNREDILAIAFAIVGLLIAGQAVKPLLTDFLQFLNATPLQRPKIPSLIGVLVQFGLGLWLLLAPRKLVRVLK